jgi:tetratricopeptide (TPR) repeat protein
VTIRLGDQAGGLAMYRKAEALRQSAADADPNDYRAAVSLASITGRIAVVLRQLRELPAALDETQRAIALWKKVVEHPGSSRNNSNELADAHEELADVYIDMKNYPRAVAEYQEAIRLYSALRDRGVLAKESYGHIDELKAQAQKCLRSSCLALN